MGRAVVGGVLVVLALAWAAVVHHGFGPRPDLELHWWSPRGFLSKALLGSSLLDDRGRAVLLFWMPSLALGVATWLVTRSALARTAVLCSALATLVFLLFGLGSQAAQLAWNLFHWRASATMLATAAVVGTLLASPWLAASWLRLGWPARLAWLVPIAFGVIAIERNVTGTNPRLPFAISPWPAVQVFGLDVTGTTLAALFGAAALGGAAVISWRGHGSSSSRARSTLAALVLVVLGFVLPAAWLDATSGSVPTGLAQLARLPAEALGSLSGGFVPAWEGVGAAVWYAALLGLAALVPLPRLATLARTLGAAALLVGIPIAIGQLWARFDYSRNRDVHAQRAIDALARYYEREHIYPESLQALVEAGDLEEVPRPRVGFGWLDERSSFTYQGFGTSYLIEFPAPRWVQCAYNPPYDEEDFDDEEDATATEDDQSALDDVLAGAWSCPSSPPELW
jgi:hypothetical protein